MTRDEVRGEIFESLERTHIPLTLRAGIVRYLFDGVRPGHFLEAVISNDLFGAMGRADENSRAGLFAICGFFYNEVPAPCFGSPAKMEVWLERSESSKRLRDRCLGISGEGPPDTEEQTK